MAGTWSKCGDVQQERTNSPGAEELGWLHGITEVSIDISPSRGEAGGCLYAVQGLFVVNNGDDWPASLA